MATIARPLGAATSAMLVISAGAVVAVPMLMLVATSLGEGGGEYIRTLREPGVGAAIASSVELSAMVTLLAVPAGAALALALRDASLPGRALWRVAVLLPLVIPDFVLGYSWVAAYGRAGLTSQLLGWTWPGMQGFLGVAVIVSVSLAPLVYLIITVGLATRADPITERAARASGAAPITVLRTVTLPLLAPAVATSAVLVFVLALGSFAVPQVVGAPSGFRTMSTMIYAELTYGSDPRNFVQATTLAVLLVAITLLVIVPGDLVLGARLRLAGTPAADPAGLSGGRIGRVAKSMSLAGYTVASTGVPLLALVVAAITRAVGVPSTPGNWTWDNFRLVLTPRTGEALARSLLLALAAASILLVLALITAGLSRTRAGQAVGVLVTLALVLPGSALAIGLLLGYGRWLADTGAIILLAYLAKLWGLAHRPISAALDRLGPAGPQAARASGAGLATSLRTVTLPMIEAALVAAWALCLVTALHEVTMSSLLYGPDTETLAVIVLNTADLGQVGATAALSVIVTAVVALPGAALWAIGRRARA